VGLARLEFIISRQIDISVGSQFGMCAVIAGLLMVSRVRYFSFKTLPVSDKVPFVWIILAVLIIVALTLNPALVLLALATAYALSGIVITLWGLRSRASRRRVRMARRHAQEAHPHE